MSKALAEDVCDGIKELIRHVSGFDTGSEGFDCVFKHFTTKLRRCDTMYFLNKRDVDSSMQGMREKFCFHGFFREAEALVQVYSEYIPEDLPKALQTSRLNVVKFLLCMSETPTKKFLENPQDYVQPVDKQENDEIDWTEYLNEGIEIWNPDHDNESEGEVEDCSDYSKSPVVPGNIQLPTIRSTERKCVLDLRSSRDELLATIQHSWYEENFFRDKPESEHREANIALIWEDFLRHLVEGFVVVENPSIITEYKVIREVLWEMWGYHTCSTFKLCGNYVQPNEHITVASVRCVGVHACLC
ncbi:uncharacterized protein LOC132706808 isoform X2 [Cylas formicarius]|uniref:uncharacterized protein LOC132706808 isoform X2 n=1 Tax=Cylas formicarius TaxID=197179 RepID=UPI002958CEEE|nr:uncharacterized protein LOC132706808 isoform X2 [Cylas formicarius]